MMKLFKRFFIPSSDTDFAPEVLERLAARVMLFLVVLTFAAANVHALIMMSSDTFISAIVPGALIDLSNKHRVEESLYELERSSLLDQAAQLKAEDMAKNEYFAHNSPTGVTPWYWFKKVGYTYAYAGENLAVHFTDSEDVVDAWMNSPGHRANILKPEYHQIGIGTAKGVYKGTPTVYVVQLFGTSLDDVVHPQTAVDEVLTHSAAILTEAPRSVEAANVISKESESSATVTLARTTPSDVAGAHTSSTPDTSTHEAAARVIEVPPADTNIKAELTPVGLVLLSDVATTSVPVGTVIRENTYTTPQNARTGFMSLINSMFTSTGVVITLVYMVLAAFVLVALSLSAMMQWRRHNHSRAVYSAGLLTLMAILLYVHIAITASGVQIV